MVCAGHITAVFHSANFRNCALLVLGHAAINLRLPTFIQPNEDDLSTAGVSMFVSDEGKLQVDNGYIRGGSHGIVVEGRGRAVLTLTRFSAIGDTAAEVRADGAGLILHRCAVNGGFVGPPPTPTPSALGVRVHQSARASVQNCTLSYCRTCCVWVDGGSFCRVLETFMEHSFIGVNAVGDNTYVRVSDCSARENSRNISCRSGAVMAGNMFSGNSGDNL